MSVVGDLNLKVESTKLPFVRMDAIVKVRKAIKAVDGEVLNVRMMSANLVRVVWESVRRRKERAEYTALHQSHPKLQRP